MKINTNIKDIIEDFKTENEFEFKWFDDPEVILRAYRNKPSYRGHNKNTYEILKLNSQGKDVYEITSLLNNSNCQKVTVRIVLNTLFRLSVEPCKITSNAFNKQALLTRNEYDLIDSVNLMTGKPPSLIITDGIMGSDDKWLLEPKTINGVEFSSQTTFRRAFKEAENGNFADEIDKS